MGPFSYTVQARHGPDEQPLPDPPPPTLLARLARAGIDPARLASAGDPVVHLHLTGQEWDRLNLGGLVAAALARPRARIDGGPWASAWVSGPGPAGTLRVLAPGRPRWALLDRDGTIIEDRHYLADPEGVTLLPGAAAGLRQLAAAGIQLAVVTNQSGLARGRITPEALAAVHRRMTDLLRAEEVTLAGIWVCPHGPDEGCACRKPGEALAHQAAQQLGLDLGTAVVVGDKPADLGLARNLGVPAFLVGTGEGAATLGAQPAPADYAVEDLAAFARVCCHPAGVGVLG